MCPKSLRCFCVGLLVLLTFRPGLSSKLDYRSLEPGGDDDDRDEFRETQLNLLTKYDFHWNSTSTIREFESLMVESTNCTENQTCDVRDDCFKCFPNMDNAFQPGMRTDIPQKPRCRQHNETSLIKGTKEDGRCTCGLGMCYSYSTDRHTKEPFYYCGPCGYIGASCEVERCTHVLAECRNGYCECIDDGVFYDMTFCYIPYYGTKMLTQMFISSIIIIVLCAILAYSYHRLANSRRQYFRRFESWRRSTVVRESPSDDTPPTYDDVVDKVPSYQDALEMENNTTEGMENPAFIDDEALPPPYDESISQATSTEGATATVISGTPEEDQPIRDDNVAIQGEDSLPVNLSDPSTSNCNTHQPIEQPLKDALETYRTQNPADVQV